MADKDIEDQKCPGVAEVRRVIGGDAAYVQGHRPLGDPEDGAPCSPGIVEAQHADRGPSACSLPACLRGKSSVSSRSSISRSGSVILVSAVHSNPEHAVRRALQPQVGPGEPVLPLQKLDNARDVPPSVTGSASPRNVSSPARSSMSGRASAFRIHCRRRSAVTRYTTSPSTRNQIVTSCGRPVFRP
jgi:hypothetical protein